ncbi:hypothetical protein Q5752_000305 [Cryptotrichosporon argae]
MVEDIVATKAIYTVFTSPHHAPMPNHLPTLIVTPHGQPNQILYTYLHTEEVRTRAGSLVRLCLPQNRVNYLLTPSLQGDLCVAKLFPPPRGGSAQAVPTVSTGPGGQKHNVVRCEASRDLKWTIENTGVMSPTYKIVNQDDTPLYQISKPNPNAEFWTMFYFKYAGHQIPPKRVEFGKVAKNPPEKGGGTRITITGKTEDEKQVWQTLGIGNEDCVEWVVCCACLNLLDDQILLAAERKQTGAGPASTAPSLSPASTRPPPGPLQRPNAGPPGPASPAPRLGPGVASSAPHPASNLAQTYRQMGAQPPVRPDPRGQPPPMRGAPPPQQGYRPPPGQQRPPPPHMGARRF